VKSIYLVVLILITEKPIEIPEPVKLGLFTKCGFNQKKPKKTIKPTGLGFLKKFGLLQPYQGNMENVLSFCQEGGLGILF